MKILIVDDEKMIRNWLAMLLHQIPGKNIEIATAGNVDDALVHCQQNEVHLVITDITMPQRTGLELLQILRETYPNICVAVLSAYDDFQYIRSAMQLGAIDYILKSEMQLSDIMSVLRKVELFSSNSNTPPARGTLTKSNDYNLADFLDDPASLKTFLTDVNSDLVMHDLAVCVFSMSKASNVRPSQILDICNKTLDSENMVGSTFQSKNAFWVIYNSKHSILEHQRETSQRLFLLLARNIDSIMQKTIQEEFAFFAETEENLCQELNQHFRYLRCRQYYSLSEDAVFSPLDQDTLRNVIKRLRFLLELHRYTEAADYLVETVKEFHSQYVDPKDLKASIHHGLTVIFLNTTALKSNILFASHYQNLNRQLNLATTAESVSSLLEGICSLYKSELKDVRTSVVNPSLKRTLDYIDKNYMNRLTLESVAQHVFLNKTYISQMFMKYLKISFVSYLESVRIYRAQELLQTTEKSVTKIAEETGYASQSYFTKAFKKCVGMTPLQYRSISLTNEDAP